MGIVGSRLLPAVGYSSPRFQSIGGLDENISLLTVLTDVQALNFLIALDAEAHRGVEHFQNDERGDGGEGPGNDDGDKLSDEKLRAAIDQADRLAVADQRRVADVDRGK